MNTNLTIKLEKTFLGSGISRDEFKRQFFLGYGFAASQLYAQIKDNLKNNLLTEEMIFSTLFPTIFLYRHSIELGIKLLEKVCFDSIPKEDKHRIGVRWVRVRDHLSDQKIFPCDAFSEIDNAVEHLKKLHLEENEENFRYLEIRVNGEDKHCFDLAPELPIFEIFEVLSSAVLKIDHLILMLFHQREIKT